MIFKKKIMVKILIIFISIQFVSLATLIVYESIKSKTYIEQSTQETEALLANQLEKSAEILFAVTEKSLLGISREKSVTDILVSSKYQQMIMQDFKRYAEMNGTVRSLMMGTADDQFYRYPQAKENGKQYNPTQQMWYRKAVANRGRVVYTSPFTDKISGEKVIMIAKTVNKDGNVIGVIGATLSIDLFQKLLQEIKIGASGHAFAVDEEGIITAHRESEKIGTSVLEESFFTEMQKAEENFLDYTLNGQKHFMKFVTNARTGWKFVVTMSRGEIQQEILETIGKKLLIFVLVLAIAAVIIVWFARTIVNPIKELASGMKRVEHGELAVEIDARGEDEVGQLMESFNHMAAQIRNLVGEISIACKTLLQSSTEYHEMCESNAAASEQVSASLENIVSGSDSQMRQAVNILKKTQEFAEQMNRIAQNAQEVHKQTEASKEINVVGVNIIKNLHTASQNNIEYVERGVKEIKGLHEKTEAVVKITKNIEDIAKQTNLISLNASIEAAKAGEHGQSFGVIAEEVHKLAEESQNFAGKIYYYLQEMMEQVDKTTAMMNDIKKTSREEYDFMIETEKIFTKIEDSSNTIGSELEALNRSIVHMDKQKATMLKGIEDITAVGEQANEWSKQIYASVDEQVQNNDRAFGASERLVEIAKLLEEKISVFRM